MYKKIILGTLLVSLGMLYLPPFARASSSQTTKAKVLALLYKQGILEKPRTLVHFSLVCNLKIAGLLYPVYDSRELVKGAVTARGYNQIIVLSPQLAVRQHIEYADARPLMCLDDKLYTWGDVNVNNIDPSGNTLEFSNQAKTVVFSETDILDMPNYSGQ